MFKRNFFRKSWGLVILGLFLIALPVAVFATTNGDSVYIGPDQIVDGNLIRFGNVIDIAGAVKGDLIVFGNTITISGPVAGDVIAAGNSIKITGDVNGSVRLAGNNIDIDSEIGQELQGLVHLALLETESSMRAIETSQKEIESKIRSF